MPYRVSLCVELTDKYRLCLPVGVQRHHGTVRKSVLIDRVAKLQAAVIAARNAVIPVATCSSLLAMGAEPARLVDHFFGWRPTEPDLQDLFQIVQATTAMRLTCRMMMRARYGLKYLTDLIRSVPMHQLHLYTKTMSITTCMAEFGAAGQQLRHEMCHVAHMDTPCAYLPNSAST